jgi:hypothetical protein
MAARCAVVGCSQVPRWGQTKCLPERAGTRHLCQLAFFARVGHSLSGNATPLQKMQIKVWTPSYCHASLQAGSSQQSFSKIGSRAGSFCPVGGSGLKDTCVSSSHPSRTCGRNLFLRGGFSHWQSQQSSMAQRDKRSLLSCTPRIPGLRAVVRRGQDPAGARPGKCIIISKGIHGFSAGRLQRFRVNGTSNTCPN